MTTINPSSARTTTAPARPVAVVTGGASGIGLAYTERLVERGYLVVVLDVGQAALEAVQAAHPDSVRAYLSDVRDLAGLTATIDRIESTLGPIQHVLGCAGIARVGPTFEVARSDIQLMVDVNFGGVVNLIDAVLPRMLARHTGEFAIIASATGLVAPRKMAAYGATKAAVIGYMQSLRYETEGQGVTVACVCPAAVATPMAKDFFADPVKRSKSNAITPQQVVARIEKGLRRKRFLIYTDPIGHVTALLARWLPGSIRALQRGKLGDLV